MFKRLLVHLRSLWVDGDIQFRFVAQLILVVMAEGLFVGTGIIRLLMLSQDWSRPNLVFDFFWQLLTLVLPLLLVNGFLGLYWSSRIARPAKALEKGLKQIRDGKLPVTVELEEDDSLRGVTENFNETAYTLNQLLTRDYKLVREAMAELEKCEDAKGGELSKILKSARSKLSIVNAHFFKGDG